MTVAKAFDTLSLLKPSEVAALFRVRVPTITRWANTGKLTCIRTLGGHRRYHQTEVQDLLTGDSVARTHRRVSRYADVPGTTPLRSSTGHVARDRTDCPKELTLS